MKTKRPIVPKRPALPAPDEAVAITDIELIDEAEFCGFALNQLDLFDIEAASVVMERARLDQIRFHGSRLPKLRLLDAQLKKCDLSNSYFAECSFNRSEFLDCKLTGFRAIEAYIADCKFQNCVGDLLQFQATKFRTTVFQKCHFRNADFRFCDLTATKFEGCDLRRAEFYDAKLQGADFRGSDLTEIKARPEDLKGIIITSQQAFDLSIQFATMLGIEINDE